MKYMLTQINIQIYVYISNFSITERKTHKLDIGPQKTYFLGTKKAQSITDNVCFENY
jgi:hypothetical protein